MAIKGNIFKGIAWVEGTIDGKSSPIALCPKHKQRLELMTSYASGLTVQENSGPRDLYLVCPEDKEQFSLGGVNFKMLQRRYNSAKEAMSLKDIELYDLDSIYTPVLRVDPKPKDKRYSIQVEIDETKEGKKLVIYAADRENTSGKTQIFIDPQSDKITFDSKGDIHPNMIFSKVVAYFKDGKTVTLEQENKKSRQKKA